MKNRGKRFIVLLLSVLMVVSQMSFVAFATEPVEDDQTGKDPVETTQPADVENDGEGGEEVVKDKEPSEPAKAEDPVKSEPEAGKEVTEPKVTEETPAKRSVLRNAGDAEAGLVVNGVITINNTTDNKIAVYGKDGGKYGEWPVEANKSLDIGLQSLDKIYANEAIKIQKPNPNFDWTTEASDKAGYKYCITFASGTIDGALSFDVVSDDNYWLVTFMSNGGDGNMDPQMVPKTGETALNTNTFTKEGSTFAGWSEDKDATEATYKDGQRVELDGDLKLYAVWKHEHNWSVTASGDTLTAKCVSPSEGCEYGGASRSLKVVAEGGAYTGEAYTAYIDKEMGFPKEFTVGAITYKSGEDVVDEAVNVGPYTASAVVTLDGTSYSWTVSTEFSISAVEPDYTAPVALDPVYNGKAQDLVNAGQVRTEGLTMKYRLSEEGDWQDAVPQATAAGSYTVYYMIGGNDNYGTVNGSVEASIAPAGFTAAPVAAIGLTYNGNPRRLLARGARKSSKVEGEIYYWISGKYDERSTSIPEAVDAGTYDVMYAIFNDGVQITDSGVISDIRIRKANARVTQAPVAYDLVYNGEKQALFEKGEASGGTLKYYAGEAPSEVDTDWQEDVYSVKKAWEGTIWYKVFGDANHNDTEARSISVRIAPKELQVKWSTDVLVYDGSAKAPTASLVDPETETAVNMAVTVEGAQTDSNLYVGADEYVATASITDANYTLTNPTKVFFIYPKTVKVKWTGTSYNYNGQARCPKVELEEPIEGCNVSVYAFAKVEGELQKVVDEAVDAGTYYAYARTDNYNYSVVNLAEIAGSDDVEMDLQEREFKIKKVAPGFEAPEAVTGLTYNGLAQALVTAGSTKDGTMMYKVGDGEFSDVIPAVTDAGDYDVTYYVKGDENHNDSEEAVIGKIHVSRIELSDLAVSIQGWNYGSDPNEPVVSGNYGEGNETFTYYKLVNNEQTGEVSEEPLNDVPTEVGDYRVKAEVAATKNYKKGSAEADFSISKAIPGVKAPAAVRGLVYSGSAQALVTAGTATGGTMKYSLTKDGEYTNSVPKGTNAGTYTVWYRVEGNESYEDADPMGPVTVTIAKAKATATPPKARDLTFTDGMQALVEEGSSEHGTYLYGLTAFNYSADIPTALDAGSYRVYYRFDGDSNHLDDAGHVDVTIKKANLTGLTLAMGSWRENEEAKSPSIEGMPSRTNPKVSYEYKERNASDESYSGEVPSAAGEYTVRAIIGESKNYNGAIETSNFRIAEEFVPPVGSSGLVYDGSAKKLIAKSGDADGTGTVKYSLDGENYKADYTKISAVEAGTHTVWYKVEGAEGFSDIEADTMTVMIAKGDALVTAPTAKTGLKYTGEQQELLNAGEVKEGAKILYKVGLLGAWSATPPTRMQAATYPVWYRIDGGDNYKDTSASLLPDFMITISRADIEATVSITGWAYGEYSKDRGPAVTGVDDDYYDDGGEVTYMYAVDDPDSEDDPVYTEEMPEDAGKYLVKAVFGETVNYNASETDPVEFTISKAEFSSKVEVYGTTEDESGEEVTGWTYGDYDEISNGPEVTHNPEGADVTYSYQKLGDNDEPVGEAFATVPTEAGHYRVSAVIAESDNYLPCTADYADFWIGKAELTRARAHILSWPYDMYDEEYNAPWTTGLPEDGEFDVIYEYAEYDLIKGKVVGDYSTTVPTKVGQYVVRGSIAETDNYKAAVTKADLFSIVKGPADKTKPAAIEELVYRGVPQNLVTPGVSGDGEYVYAVTDSKREPAGHFSKEIPQKVDAGTYYVWYKFIGDGSHSSNLLPRGPIEVTIDKAQAEVDFDDLDLVYNGKEQKLVEAEATGGTLEFRHKILGVFTDYNTKVPTGTDAGDYTVWYRVVGDDNYYGVEPTEVKATIKKASITPVIDFPLGVGVWTYGLPNLNLPYVTAKSNPGRGAVTFEYSKSEGSYSEGFPVNAGGYNIKATVAATKNYLSGTAESSYTILQAAIIENPAPKAKEGLYYNGGYQELITAGKVTNGKLVYSKTEGGSYSSLIPTGKNEGEYTVYYKVVDYDEVNYYLQNEYPREIKVKISPREDFTPEVSIDGWNYGDEANDPVVNGNLSGGKETIEYKPVNAPDGDYSEEVPEDAGQYMMRVTIDAKGKYNKAEATTVFTIAKLPVSLSWNDVSYQYNGEVQTLKLNDAFEGMTGVLDKDKGKVEAVLRDGYTGTNVGEYDAEAGLTGDKANNYNLVAGDQFTWKITQADLTISARPKTISYGEAPSNAGVIYSGFAKGDTAADLDGELNYSYSYKQNGRPGSYSIKPYGLSSDNYKIVFKSGTLTVSDVESVLVAQVASAGKTKTRLTWNSATGADSYDVYFAKCGKKGKYKKVATVGGNTLSYTKNKLKKKTCYKFYVVAKRGGAAIAVSPEIHVITGNVKGKLTNAKSITLNTNAVTINKGGTAQLSASIKKAKKGKKLINSTHAALVRYTSSNPAVATVNGNGTIYGVGSGYCKVYAQTVNGIWQIVDVTVN